MAINLDYFTSRVRLIVPLPRFHLEHPKTFVQKYFSAEKSFPHSSDRRLPLLRSKTLSSSPKSSGEQL